MHSTWSGSYSRLHGGWRKPVEDRTKEVTRGCVLSLRVQFAVGLDLLIAEITREATAEYGGVGFDVAALDPDRMAVSSRALHRCSFLLLLRRDGECPLADADDVRGLARLLLRTVAYLEDGPWVDVRQALADTESSRQRLEALDRNAEGWAGTKAEYLNHVSRTDRYRAELASIEEVAAELLLQMVPEIPEPPSEFEAEQYFDEAMAVTA